MRRAFFACIAAFALPLAALAGHPARAQDSEQALFARCGSGARVTCVVDGDTFWYRGSKIRLSDINTPETSQPGCASERALGERATDRLIVLLNQGAFTLTTSGRDMDRYGRLLRVASRDGQSIGAVLVAEGLAEQWQGRRGDWCAA
jgi:micrococcal nuclease